MRYYINTSKGALKNVHGVVVKFNSYSDARHCAINYCDLSDKKIEIIDSYETKEF